MTTFPPYINPPMLCKVYIFSSVTLKLETQILWIFLFFLSHYHSAYQRLESVWWYPPVWYTVDCDIVRCSIRNNTNKIFVSIFSIENVQGINENRIVSHFYYFFARMTVFREISMKKKTIMCVGIRYILVFTTGPIWHTLMYIRWQFHSKSIE